MSSPDKDVSVVDDGDGVAAEVVGKGTHHGEGAAARGEGLEVVGSAVLGVAVVVEGGLKVGALLFRIAIIRCCDS